MCEQLKPKQTNRLNTIRANATIAFFAREIKRQLIRHPRLEDDGFKLLQKGQLIGMRWDSRGSSRWRRFPPEWKREYLHYKVQRDAESPSNFSRTLRRLADQSGQSRTAEEEYALIDKLMDGYMVDIIKITPFHDLPSCKFLPSKVEGLLKASDSSPMDEGIIFQQLLAISAIVRGDAIEFQRILDRMSGLEVQSPLVNLSRFRQDFLSIEFASLTPALMHPVGAFGNADIMRVVLANKRPNTYTQRKWLRGELTAVTAGYGNRDGLTPLIEHLAAANEDEISIFSWTPRKSLSHRLRGTFLRCFTRNPPKLDMADVILEHCGADANDPDLQFDILMQAIKSGDVDAVQYALKKARPQINRQTKAYNYHSPLFFTFFTVRQGSPTNYQTLRAGRLSGRLPVMKALLENGADLSQPHVETGKTLLQYAIERKSHSTIELILDYETELYGVPSLLSGDSENRSFWLRTAFHGRCFFLIDLLVQNGVTRFKGKRGSYDARMIESSEDEISDDEDLPDWLRDLNQYMPRRWSKMPIHFYRAPIVDFEDIRFDSDMEDDELEEERALHELELPDDEDCICRPWCRSGR